MPRTSTPRLFQVIREFLLEQKEGLGEGAGKELGARSTRPQPPGSLVGSIPDNEGGLGWLGSNETSPQKDAPSSGNLLSMDATQPGWLGSSGASPQKDAASSGSLLSMDAIRQAAKERFPERAATQAELDTVVGLLQSRGLVHRLAPQPSEAFHARGLPNAERAGKMPALPGEPPRERHLPGGKKAGRMPIFPDWVLLRPELINQYGASIIQAARNHSKGIGAVAEREVLTGRLSFTGFERLPKGEEAIVLEALANALDRLNDNKGKYDGWLKVAVFHHPVTGQEAMNGEFMELLAVHGFGLCLHGHVHKAMEDYHKYDDKRGIRIAGAGTFGAPAKEQVPGIPLQYNLLTLDSETGEMTVHTRKKKNPEGAWDPDPRWGDKKEPKAWYSFPAPGFEPGP